MPEFVALSPEGKGHPPGLETGETIPRLFLWIGDAGRHERIGHGMAAVPACDLLMADHARGVTGIFGIRVGIQRDPWRKSGIGWVFRATDRLRCAIPLLFFILAKSTQTRHQDDARQQHHQTEDQPAFHGKNHAEARRKTGSTGCPVRFSITLSLAYPTMHSP